MKRDVREFIPRDGIRAIDLAAAVGLSGSSLDRVLKRQELDGEVVKVTVSHRHVRWYVAGQEPSKELGKTFLHVEVKSRAFAKDAQIVIPPGLKITQCPSAWKDKPLPEPDAAIPKREGAEDWRKCGRGMF